MKEKKTGLLKSLSVVFVAGMILLGLVLLYPFWRLFAWVANIIGVKGIRRTGKNIETPVVFYEHPETKRRVVFIATMHIAEPEYFAALQRLIDSLSDYKVLFEGVGKITPQERQAFSKQERRLAKDFEYIFGLMSFVGTMMSLRHQRECLAYRSNWVNTDMKLGDIVRLFASYDVCLLSKKERKLTDVEDETTKLLTQWFLNKLFSQFVSVFLIERIVVFFSRQKGLAKKFILETRNEEAVRGIDKYLTEGNVATVWGAAHLRGIEKRLKRAGFREIRREWFTAYRIRKYSLLKCIKKMITLSNDEKYGHCTE